MRKTHIQWTAEDCEDTAAFEKPSRSEKKRRALTLQKLGEDLAKSQNLWDSLPLPDALLLALKENLRLSSHEAHRRQLQYIGRLMRELSTEDIEIVKTAIRHGEQKFA